MQAILSVEDDLAAGVRGARISVALITTAYLALTACYLAAAIGISMTLFFWQDEVLAVWAARLPTYAAVVDAIWNGAEFSPPTYDLFLHTLFVAFGSSKIVARLPSIVAILVAAAAFARIATKELDARLGVLVYGLVLDSLLFAYAIQARPYALLIMLDAVVILLWSAYPRDKAHPLRAMAIAMLLAGGVALHVYGIVGLAVLAAIEAIWGIASRRLRLSIWIALSAAGIASLAWFPLFAHLAAYNGGDTAAPLFYAKPTAMLFISSLGSFVPIKAASAAIGLMVGSLIVFRCRSSDTPLPSVGPVMVSMTAGLLAALPIAFLLSVFVTHAFSPRYALQAIFGFALLLVIAIRFMPSHGVIALLIVPILCLGLVQRATVHDYTVGLIDLMIADGGSDPIATGDGARLLEFMEAAPPRVRSRLVFLKDSPEMPVLDPTNEHQVMRLLSFMPDLPIKDSLAFIADHHEFKQLVLRGATPDPLDRLIAARGWATSIEASGPDGAIIKVSTSRARSP